MLGHTVELTYFKCGGKYYTTDSYESKKIELFEIHDEVREMQKSGEPLPGLSGSWDGLILVNVPSHPNDHPRIIMSENLCRLLIAYEEMS